MKYHNYYVRRYPKELRRPTMLSDILATIGLVVILGVAVCIAAMGYKPV
jgi:hypothetical protein